MALAERSGADSVTQYEHKKKYLKLNSKIII